jgi:hypothetical protein
MIHSHEGRHLPVLGNGPDAFAKPGLFNQIKDEQEDADGDEE